MGFNQNKTATTLNAITCLQRAVDCCEFIIPLHY